MVTVKYKITVRFTSETPTLRVEILENADAISNIATVLSTFETRQDIKSIHVKRVMEQVETLNIDTPSVVS